ncbi:M15 family metallopeptidase [Demetria terragena]|uniref:M15 family metallopeptidase n=1 Tax=Demetria terragena TaxID=63959 RepID=UPI000380D131|nr:M15 family metallopeptidase [Demetria terragena]
MLTLSRRHLLRAAIGSSAALGIALGSSASPVSAASSADVDVMAEPMTTDRVLVAVDAAKPGSLSTAVVRGPAGKALGKATLSATGKALVPVKVAANAETTLTITVLTAGKNPTVGFEETITVSTQESRLASSIWRVVNKRLPMGADEVPEGLETVAGLQFHPAAAVSFLVFQEAALAQKVSFQAVSAYRTYARQKTLYDGYVEREGRDAADRYSARPGHSEHQTGLAIDARASDDECTLDECFEDTPEGTFIAQHAADHGFVIRYTKGNGGHTGYDPEPWHLRYVGTWMARYLKESKATSLEEAWGLPAAPDYGP